MGIKSDIARLKRSGQFEPDGGGLRTGTIWLGAAAASDDDEEDEEMENVERKSDSESNGIVHIMSLTCFMNSAFPTKVTRPDEKSAESDVHVQEEEEDWERAQEIREQTGGQQTLFTITIDDIYERLARYWERVLSCSQDVHTCIILADKRERIPPEKWATQKKRAERSKPYPPTTVLGDNEVLVTDDAGNQHKALIQPHRLMQTRALREPLYRQLMKRSAKDARFHAYHIIWDVTHDAPVEHYDGVEKKRPDLDMPTVGEDDILMPIYAMRYRHCRILGTTKDRDQEHIWLLNIEKLEESVPSLILRFGDGKHMDMLRYVNELRATGWNVKHQYVVAHILCNTDFFDQSVVLLGFGVDKIFAAVRVLGPQRDYVSKISDFLLLLRLLYSYRFGWKDRVATWSELQEEADQRAPNRQFRFPDRDALRRAHQALYFNFHYWQSLHSTNYVVPPWPPKESASLRRSHSNSSNSSNRPRRQSTSPAQQPMSIDLL